MYAAGAFFIWLTKTYGDDTIRALYRQAEQWESDLHWHKVHKQLADASGASMSEITRQFGRDYWEQSFAPMDRIEMNEL